MARDTKHLDRPRTAQTSRGQETDRFGRLADGFVQILGSGRYLVIQTAYVVVWVALNAFAWSVRWDGYPFVFLNLVFSTQAAYAAPLILLTQNRQYGRDKAVIERDRKAGAGALAETEYLARELADLNRILDRKLDRDDVAEPVARLALAIESFTGRALHLDDDED